MSTLKRWPYLLCLFLTWRAGLLVSAFTGCSHGSVRLSSGTSYYGRVEVCIGGEWGTVCKSGWDSNDAAVVCRQLGYSTSGASTYYLSSGDGAIYMNNVNCRGTELSVFQCDYQSLIGDYYPCSHSYDAGVYCSSSSACIHGQVRLTGSDVSTEGNVEICNYGQWNGVCSNSFNYRAAMVVCAQLGLPSTNAQSNSYRYSRYPIVPTYNYSYFNCYGYESSIMGCSSYCCYSCDFSSRAGVTCRGSVAQPTTGSCPNQTVRLVNGSDENEGRVEVCRNGVWGTVYGGYGWDSRGGRVVCRQLGFQNPAVFIYADNTFGAGSGPVFIEYISCIGTEASLFQCSTGNNNYNDRSSAALRCENYPTNQGCQPGSVRLVGGSSPQEGRIEVCAESSPGVTVWGSVCNAQYYGIAEVVCRQLHYSRSGAVVYNVMPFGPSQNPFVLDGVYCNGGESSLLSCSNSGYHRCHKGQESGVKCQNLCTSGDVHLVDGYTPTEGRLEMCINGSWTSFYGYYSYWDTYAANVACRQMFGSAAFGTSQYTSGSYPYLYGSQYGQGTGWLVISQILCIGNEKSLSSCSYVISTGYGHYYDAGIRCYVNTSCAEGQVRLVDGNTANEGRVELCSDGVWVAIYSSGWNYNDAVVVCRQLGYHYEWAIPYGGSYFGKGTTLLEFCSMYCTGSEASIGQCSNSTIPRITNYNSRTWCGLYLTSTSNSSAGVMCLGPTTNVPECTSGDIQLADGPSSREGRLKICKRDGYWASVCVNGIDKTAALIVCKSIGINATGVRVSSGQCLTYTGPIISHLSCTGRESNWKDCALGSVGSVNCGYDKAAVISCLNDIVSYDVTVTTDPANGPFAIGSSVSLYCQSNPPFPTGVTYTWRAAIRSTVIRVDNPQAYNASITIGLNHPTIGHYYCEVKNGASVIGVGKTDIIVQSLIKTNLNPTLKFSPPQTIVLSVNVTELEVTRYLGSLNWYFEGDRILMGGRFLLSPDSTTLTITNTVESDAGIYEVKHMGLLISQRQEKCESRVLDVLRNYPILSGIRFTVINILSGVQQAVSDAHVLPLSIGGPMSIQLSWTHLPGPGYMWYFIRNSYATSVLYYNGQVGAPSCARVSSVRLYGANDAYQNMTIDLVCAQDSGYLDASLMISTYSYLYYGYGSNQFYCPSQYYSFVTQTLGITSIQLDSTTLTFTHVHVDHSSATVVGSELPLSGVVGITVGGVLLVLLLVVLVIVVAVIVTKRNKIKATLTSDAEAANQAMRYAVCEERIEEVPCKGDEDYYANLRRSAANFEDSNVYEPT